MFSGDSLGSIRDFEEDLIIRENLQADLLKEEDSELIPDCEEFCFSLVEEGTAQPIKCTLEVEACASKNMLGTQHCKPELYKLPQKSLTSMNSPFTSVVQEVSQYHPTSPILRKLVFCQQLADSSDTLEIVAAVSTTGFSTALSLEYSNVEIQNKACVDYRRAEKLLLTNSIARAISENSAVWLSCGFEHCALVTYDGKIMTWGYGASGSLGHGDSNSYGFPKLIQSIRDENFKYIECGGYHTLAISDAGELFLWGRGDVNQLGLPHRQLCKDEHEMFFSFSFCFP